MIFLNPEHLLMILGLSRPFEHLVQGVGGQAQVDKMHILSNGLNPIRLDGHGQHLIILADNKIED